MPPTSSLQPVMVCSVVGRLVTLDATERSAWLINTDIGYDDSSAMRGDEDTVAFTRLLHVSCLGKAARLRVCSHGGSGGVDVVGSDGGGGAPVGIAGGGSAADISGGGVVAAAGIGGAADIDGSGVGDCWVTEDWPGERLTEDGP
ncbi:hypothetical protein Tco_1204058 [Tanacetum coccineum]